ncbi:hypothetical protein EPN52_02570 [bacterium]|nr:MAG: hypothetical protein EPN52_02570 [bacterium]
MESKHMVRLELYGMARHLVGAGDMRVPVAPDATVGALLREAARLAPALVGVVLEADGTPIAPNYVLLDGRGTAALDDPVSDGDRPCLFVLASGG